MINNPLDKNDPQIAKTLTDMDGDRKKLAEGTQIIFHQIDVLRQELSSEISNMDQQLNKTIDNMVHKLDLVKNAVLALAAVLDANLVGSGNVNSVTVLMK